MRKKNTVILILFLLILIIICSSIICFYAFSFNHNYFAVFPFLNDQSDLIFELFDKPEHFSFLLKIPGATVFEKLSLFCANKSCSIPMILGGTIIFEVFNKKRKIYSNIFHLSHMTMNCTDEPWTNRICTFRNICYNKDDTFYFESPYRIQFESNFLCLGSKTPPVDLELNRMPSGKFKTVNHFNTFIQKNIKEPSHLVSIYYNMHMLWHSFYDFLFPLYQTLNIFANNSEIRKRRIFLPEFVPEIPHLTQSLTKFQVEKLKNPLCFNELTMGMKKITNLKLDKDDPPYSFCKNCSFGLRSLVMQYFNITDTNKYKKYLNIVFLGRKSMTRNVINEKEVFESLKNHFAVDKLQQKSKEEKENEYNGNYVQNNNEIDNVQIHYFEVMPLKKQIEIISKTDVFIAVHGSGLANILWMRPGSSVIEIMPKDFTCRDWYMKAAEAAGVNYYAYYAKNDGETVGGNIEEAKKCASNKKKCSSKKCIDILRDRNIKLNVQQFMKELINFLKSVDLY